MMVSLWNGSILKFNAIDTWPVFGGDDVLESVDDDGDDGEGERQDPAEQRVDGELLPLRAGAQSKLSRGKLETKNTRTWFHEN